MKGSEFVFDSVDLLYDKLHKIILNQDSKPFQCAITVLLNYKNIKKNLERI